MSSELTSGGLNDMPEGDPISPAQCRAARGILSWTQRELAEAAQVAERTVARFEGSEAERRAGLAPRALRAAFEKHGVGFAECHGVYWRPAKR